MHGGAAWYTVLVVGVFLALPQALHAQDEEHPFIRTFTLLVVDDRILVSWTMTGGSTCDGSEVLRSTNGVDFTPVHSIEGICGDEFSDVPFSWWDNTPPEFSTIHYRIKFGFLGSSSIKTVEFAQLTTSQQRFFPSPMREEATLVLNIPASASVDLVIFDAAGRLVWEQQGLVGRTHRITLPGVPAGLYTYLARTDGRSFQGRFVKE
jgi:hypothetical protein